MFKLFLSKAIAVLCLFHLAPASSNDIQNQGFRVIHRMYDECFKSEFGIMPCFKKKAITFIDRLNRFEVVNVSEGMKIIQNENETNTQKDLSESDLEEMLPRSAKTRDEMLNNMLIERIAKFFSSKTVAISLPKVSSNELGQEIEEGRGKMKKMMSMMMMGMMMKFAAMVPVAIAGLYILAGKALIISKIALLLAGIIGLKKLLQSKNSSSGWQSSGGGHGGGWDRRSYDSQNIVYQGYLNENKS